jgi:hypothetical protein
MSFRRVLARFPLLAANDIITRIMQIARNFF